MCQNSKMSKHRSNLYNVATRYRVHKKRRYFTMSVDYKIHTQSKFISNSRFLHFSANSAYTHSPIT